MVTTQTNAAFLRMSLWRMSLWRMSLWVVIVMCVTSRVSAQPSAPPDERAEQIEKAQIHYKRGRKFDDVGKYKAAAREYLKAYDLYPHPEFLFNLAQVYREAHRNAQAITYFNRYLQQAPSGRGADEAKRWLDILRQKHISEPPSPPTDQQPLTKNSRESRTGEISVTPIITANRDNDASVRNINMGMDLRSSPPGHDNTGFASARTLKLGGIATAGAGMVALAIGAKFNVDVLRINGELERKFDPRKKTERDNAERNSIISYTAGGVALAAGAALYYWGLRTGKRKHQPRVTVVAAPVSGRAAIAFTQRF